MGRLTQVVYPSLGIRFIAIQERVDTLTGDGVEMMPFHNIFNEWHATQTSKKIRAVWQSKAEHGERVSPTVPYGYKKSETDKKQWLIDDPAAEVVRKIYALCLAGRGPSQIARQLEEEHEQQIIPNMQEPIISEEQWLRVQELRQHRRPTATGILSDERFSKMLQSYEKEQKALTQEVADSQQTLQDAKQKLQI